MTLSPIRKVFQGIADRREMFRMFDRHAQRPDRGQGDDHRQPSDRGVVAAALARAFVAIVHVGSLLANDVGQRPADGSVEQAAPVLAQQRAGRRFGSNGKREQRSGRACNEDRRCSAR